MDNQAISCISCTCHKVWVELITSIFESVYKTLKVYVSVHNILNKEVHIHT